LDLPEVQLVAIMDADKEGFLRSETSLIQTIGRAARNKDGYVIMYADKMTDSISKSVIETKRRREIQLAHNKKYKIKPETIKKGISDILEIVEKSRSPKENISYKTDSNLKNASRKDLTNISKEIEKEMHLAADLLEFEVAARLRDELKEIKKEMMELPE
jgi:excinuclease ABC subunit B